MIIPDVNVLLHAHDVNSSYHVSMKAWWERSLSGSRPIGLPWVVLLGFLRISTNPAIWDKPMKVQEACKRIRAWISTPRAEIITEGPEHMDILLGLLEGIGTAGNLTTDAHIAALAIEYQAEVATTDRDFARFPRVRHFNPATT